MVHELIVKVNPSIVDKLRSQYEEVFEASGEYVAFTNSAIIAIIKKTWTAIIYSDTIRELTRTVEYLRYLNVLEDVQSYLFTMEDAAEFKEGDEE